MKIQASTISKTLGILFLGALATMAWMNWVDSLVLLCFIVLIPTFFATSLYLIAFGFGLIKFRSLAKAHVAAWDIWKDCFVGMIDKII